jgi:hypothetical protein
VSDVQGSLTPALTRTHEPDITASHHLDIRLFPAYSAGVRTTLDIDEDVLRAAKSIARAQETSLGRVVSSLTFDRGVLEIVPDSVPVDRAACVIPAS